MTTLVCAISTFLEARIGIVANKTAQINKGYLRSLVDFFGEEQALETLTLNHLRTWRAWLFQRETKYASDSTFRPLERGKLSVHTIHGMVRTCRQFFKWNHDEGFLPTNPAARLELPPLPQGPPKHITAESVLKMFAAARSSVRDTALLWFLHDTACRLGGAASLQLSELDVERGTATVWEKGRGGKKKARPVFLKPLAREALCAWLAVRPVTRGLDGKPLTNAVFVSERHPHDVLTEGAVYARVKTIAKAAGVFDSANPQAWRHGFAKRFLWNGGSLGALSQILGHSDIKVTHESYAVWVDRELQEQHARFA